MKSTSMSVRKFSTPILMTTTRECPSPLGIANGYMITRPPYKPGDYLTFSCSAGFFMIGSPSLKCLTTSTWLGSPPHCDPIDISPKVFNDKSDISQVPFWLLLTFSSLFAMFILASALLLLCHCCLSKKLCLLPSSRAKVHHQTQWKMAEQQNSNEEQKQQNQRKEKPKYLGKKRPENGRPILEEKNSSAMTKHEEKTKNYSSLENYGKILNETKFVAGMGESLPVISESLPVIYAIPFKTNKNQIPNNESFSKAKMSEMNSNGNKKFHFSNSISNQEIFSLDSNPNEQQPVIFLQSESCIYSDRKVGQRFKQSNQKSGLKEQQSAFDKTCSRQRQNLQAVKPQGQWLPHSRPVRNINTSTK